MSSLPYVFSLRSDGSLQWTIDGLESVSSTVVVAVRDVRGLSSRATVSPLIGRESVTGSWECEIRMD